MQITIKPFVLRGFNVSPDISNVALRVYALNYFVSESNGQIVQPGGPGESPFYNEWPCNRVNSELHLPQINLESTLDALAPAHPESLRYFAGFFDPGGNMLAAFWPRPIFALDINPNPTSWAHVIAYNSPGVEYDWTTTYAEHYSKEEFNAMLQNPPVSGISVLPPLQFDGTTLWIPRASQLQDGYLAAEDFVAFSGGGAVPGVLTFNLREGAVVLLPADLIAVLGFLPGPLSQINAGTGLEVAEGGTSITTEGTLRIANQPGLVDGIYFNPTVTVNLQGQITHIVSGAGGDPTPPVISSLSVTGIGTNAATITWNTDDPANSAVHYGTDITYGATPVTNATLQTSGHSIPLSSLVPGQTYHFHVVSVGPSGTADSLTSGDLMFTTHPTLDTSPPTFSNVGTSGLTDTTVTIHWDTNELADSQVAYGSASGSYGATSAIYDGPSATPPSAMKTTGHSVTLTSLTPSHTYHYQIKSRDAAGNLGLSDATLGDLTFVTTAPAVDPTIGLVSYWPMDETSGTRGDIIGPNDLIVASGITVLVDTGIVGNAVKGVGASYIYTNDDPSQHFSGPFTVAGWFYVDSSVPASTLTTVMQKWGTAPLKEFLLLYSYDSTTPSNSGLIFGVSRDGTAETTATVSGLLAFDTWHYAVGWFDGANVNIQVNNGTPVAATVPGSGPVFASSAGMATLVYGAGGINYFSWGRVDEVGIWNRVLTTAERTHLYTKGLAGVSYPWP